jgi:hypothetical protein
MKKIKISFGPDPVYTGKYLVKVYGQDQPDVVIGEQVLTGPFGSKVSFTTPDLPEKDAYRVTWQNDAGRIVGEQIFTVNKS